MDLFVATCSRLLAGCRLRTRSFCISMRMRERERERGERAWKNGNLNKGEESIDGICIS